MVPSKWIIIIIKDDNLFQVHLIRTKWKIKLCSLNVTIFLPMYNWFKLWNWNSSNAAIKLTLQIEVINHILILNLWVLPNNYSYCITLEQTSRAWRKYSNIFFAQFRWCFFYKFMFCIIYFDVWIIIPLYHNFWH